MVIRCANVLPPQFFDELKSGCVAQGHNERCSVWGLLVGTRRGWVSGVKVLLTEQTNKQTSEPRETSMRSRLASARTKRQIGRSGEKKFSHFLRRLLFRLEVYSLSALIVEPVRVIFSQSYSRMDMQDRRSYCSSVLGRNNLWKLYLMSLYTNVENSIFTFYPFFFRSFIH